ncbi:hypothetical protein V8E55_007406 [Tylopilus felleus]
MFSSIFDNTSESKLWSGFSWNTGRSSRPATKLEHVINHVFSPVYYPPHKGDFTEENAHALACAVHASACAYSEHIEDANKPHWLRVTKMLENFRVIITPGRPRYQDATSQLGGMEVGDVFLFPARSYGVTFRRKGQCTLCEFVRPPECPDGGRLASSYPGLAIEIPNEVFDDESLRSKIAVLLCGRLHDRLTGVLRGVGHPVKPECITKRSSFSTTIKDEHWSRSLPTKSSCYSSCATSQNM